MKDALIAIGAILGVGVVAFGLGAGVTPMLGLEARNYLSGGFVVATIVLVGYHAILGHASFFQDAGTAAQNTSRVFARPRAIEMTFDSQAQIYRASQRLLIAGLLPLNTTAHVTIQFPRGIFAEPVGHYAWKELREGHWEIQLKDEGFFELGEFVVTAAAIPPTSELIDVRLSSDADGRQIDSEHVRLYLALGLSTPEVTTVSD